MDPLAEGTFPQPCPELAFTQHSCRIRCVDASSMSLSCRALPMGKVPQPTFWLWGVFVAWFLVPHLHFLQSWSSTHHPGWKLHLSPVPLSTLN